VVSFAASISKKMIHLGAGCRWRIEDLGYKECLLEKEMERKNVLSGRQEDRYL